MMAITSFEDVVAMTITVASALSATRLVLDHVHTCPHAVFVLERGHPCDSCSTSMCKLLQKLVISDCKFCESRTVIIAILTFSMPVCSAAVM